VKLTDYSELRSSELIDIPLNGQEYQAITDPPGAIVVAMTTVDFDPDLIARFGEEGADLDSMGLTAQQKAEAIRATNSQARKNLKFLDAVLTPEAAERWRYYFAPLPALEDDKPYPKKTVEEHRRHRITAAQMAAVVRELISVYSGRRPTGPSSSSASGDGGSGKTSTVSAPSGE
jgi:hypothetical protein